MRKELNQGLIDFLKASPTPFHATRSLAQRLQAAGYRALDERPATTVFKVLRDASKPEIKAAVEMLFKVEVEAVRVVNIAGKQKRFGRTMGRRSDVRKAYVALKAGQEINFSEAA